MEALATKTTNSPLGAMPVSKGERLELQKKLYNYIIAKWNKSNKDHMLLNRSEISRAIGCEVNRVSNIVISLIDKGLIEMGRLKKRSADIYNVFSIKTAPNYYLTRYQQDILTCLKNRKGTYECYELVCKVGIEYFTLIKELKDLKEKALIDMWYSKDSHDIYAYNVKNNSKGEYKTSLIDFFYSQQDRIKIRKEKKSF